MKYKLTLKVKSEGEPPVFKEGFEPGVLATQELDYGEVSEHERRSHLFLSCFLQDQCAFLDQCVEIIVEEI